MLQPSDLKEREETLFTYYDLQADELYTFAVDRIKAHISAISLVTGDMPPDIVHGIVPVDPAHAKMLFKDAGIEKHRLYRLTIDNLARQPILIARLPDETCVIIDGNHHYVRAFQLGVEGLPCVIAPEHIWRQYLVDISSLCPDKEERIKLFKKFSKEGFSGIQ